MYHTRGPGPLLLCYFLLVQTERKGYVDLMTLQALWCMVAMESHWITVWIWLMENGSNSEVSQRLPGMYYPSWGLTTQRLIQASQTKCLCLRGRRYRNKWLHEDWFTSSLRIHVHVQSRLVIVLLIRLVRLNLSEEVTKCSRHSWGSFWSCHLAQSH